MSQFTFSFFTVSEPSQGLLEHLRDMTLGFVLAHWIITAIRTDLVFIHQSWMSLLFPHQYGRGHTVLGKYRPQTRPGLVFYWFWAILGIPLTTAVYPFVLLGFVLRLTTHGLSRIATRLGIYGVVILVGILWGVLTVIAFFQFELEEFLALSAAAIVATASAGLAVFSHNIDGRATTVLIAYPAAVTAIFLPPVVAALFWEPLGDVILPYSEQLAVWILNELLFVFGLNDLIRAAFDLDGPGFIGMWLAISLAVGWLLGTIVTLADIVRPRPDDDSKPRPE